MIFLIIILLLLQILTYLIIRGGTMNKSPEEIEREKEEEIKWLKEQQEKKARGGRLWRSFLSCILM